MRYSFYLLFLAAFSLLAVSQGTCKKKNGISADCIDKSKISKGPCTMDYHPVCGCDHKTYPNACAAEHAGVTHWEEGECK